MVYADVISDEEAIEYHRKDLEALKMRLALRPSQKEPVVVSMQLLGGEVFELERIQEILDKRLPGWEKLIAVIKNEILHLRGIPHEH